MKTLKPIFALALAAAFFVGCSKSETNTNSSNTNTTNAKASASPAATTSTPATSSSSGAGETFTHAEGGIQFMAPAGWKPKNEGEVMTVASPDDTLSVSFWVPKGDDFEKAVDALGDELEKVIKNSKITSPGEMTTHNGMKAYTASGTGEVDNEQIAWEVDMLQAKKPVIVLSFAAPTEFAKHERAYKQLIDSIKKVN